MKNRLIVLFVDIMMLLLIVVIIGSVTSCKKEDKWIEGCVVGAATATSYLLSKKPSQVDMMMYYKGCFDIKAKAIAAGVFPE